jgi:hypothetical protein
MEKKPSIIISGEEDMRWRGRNDTRTFLWKLVEARDASSTGEQDQ